MLLPLQGEHYHATLPRVPVPLRVTSVLGLGLLAFQAVLSRPKNTNNPIHYQTLLTFTPPYIYYMYPHAAFCLLDISNGAVNLR